MTKLWEGLAVVDDMTGFGHIRDHLPGLPFYSDRALLTPVDIAVVMDDGEDLEAYLAYLRRVRIGPKRVLRVKGPELFKGLDADPAAMEVLHQHLRHGGLLQVFCRTPGSEAFFERHRIEPKRVFSAPREIADLMNDKARVRQVAKDIGLDHVVLPHVAAHDPQVVMAAVKAYLAKPAREIEYVVVKRTNLAGGDGFMRLTRDLPEAEVEERVRAYLREHSWNRLTVTSHSELMRRAGEALTLDQADIRDVGRDLDEGCQRIAAIIQPLLDATPDERGYVILRNRNVTGEAYVKFHRGRAFTPELRRFLLDHCRNEILVEAGIAGDDFSMQVVVDHGNLRFLGPTKQIVDAEGRHMGNAMVRRFDASLERHGLRRIHKDVMESVSRDLTQWSHTRVNGEYRGVEGYDFRTRAASGDVYLMECNARKTASTYIFGVLAQLEDGRFREPMNLPAEERPNWGIVMLNEVPTSARSWGAVEEKLGGLLFNGLQGALPFNIRLMKLEKPAVGIVAVGMTLDKAYAVMRLAQRKLK
ncbi:MAG TPA: hypothetical protein VL500_02730 [Candidatus Eisenbacteria bacterium]|nr:hypothetical protein [Candidatus Eisenbacteria bacterium]